MSYSNSRTVPPNTEQYHGAEAGTQQVSGNHSPEKEVLVTLELA